MKKIYYLIFVSIFSSFITNISAQDGVFKFAKEGSDVVSINSSADTLGNFYTVGTFDGVFAYEGLKVAGLKQSEYKSIFILKTSPAGTPVWLHSITGIRTNDMVKYNNFCINDKGEIALQFTVANTKILKIAEKLFNLDSNLIYSCVAKFNPQGYLIWFRHAQVSSNFSLTARDIEMDKNGNVYSAGIFGGSSLQFDTKIIPQNPGGETFYLTKYSTSGEVLWVTSCLYGADTALGDINIRDISISPDGSVFVAGNHNKTQTFIFGSSLLKSKGVLNAFVAYFDMNGKALWAIPFEGNNYIYPQQIKTDSEGNAVFTCYFNSSVLILNGTNYYGSTNFNLLVCKIKPNKTFNWVNQINTNAIFYRGTEIGFSENLDVIIACQGNSGLENLIFNKLDKDKGSSIWNLTSNSTDGTMLRSTIIDKKGNIFTRINTSGLFGIGTDTVNSASINGIECFIKINSEGKISNFYKHQNFDASTNLITFADFGVDGFGNLFIVGYYYGSNANIGIHNLSKTSTSGMFITKYGPVTSISGKILDSYGNEIGAGMVKLIGYSYYQRSSITDSVLVKPTGVFVFPEVPFGRYILKYEPSVTNQKTLLPVYFPAAGRWIDAAKVDVNQLSPFTNIFIVVPPRSMQTGLATLAGLVTSIDSSDVFKSAMGKAQPRAKASLARGRPKSDFEIIDITETDDYGDFSFNYVDDGDYTIFIEVPGLPNVNPHEVTVSGGMYVSNLNYFIGEEYIEGYGSPSLRIDESAVKSDIKVFPNPSSGAIQIEIPAGKNISQLIISNAMGQELTAYSAITNHYKLENLSPGIYFLRFISGNEQEVVKILIKP